MSPRRKRARLTSPLLLFILILAPAIYFGLIKPRTAGAAWFDGAWKYRKSLVFNNSAQPSNLTNFPVMVKLTTANFDFTQAKSDGADIRFTDSNGTTVLNYDIEKYDSVNRQAVIWVSVPQIDASSSTDSIYIYWGNSKASSTANADATWGSNYKGVYHLADSAANTTVTDSSGNSNSLTASANTNAQYANASGKLGNGFTTMGTPHRLPNVSGGYEERFPSIQLDSNNFPVTAYYDNTNNNLNIVHCNDLDCIGDDESVTAPDSTNTVGAYPSLQLDASGFPVVAYQYSSGADLRILHCNDVNCAGGDDTVSTVDSTGLVGYYPSLALDASGFPVVAYYDATNTNVKLIHCNDAYCAGGDESIVTIDGASSIVGNGTNQISLVLDSNDYPVIVYYDNTNTDLKMTRCNDVNCAGGDDTPATVVSSTNTVGLTPVVRLDSNGYPMISYDDRTLLDMMFLHCNDAYCAGGDDTPVAVTNSSDYFPTMELDNNGIPVIVYPEGQNYLRVAYCSDANCSTNTQTRLHLFNTMCNTQPSIDFDSNNNLVIAVQCRGKSGASDVNLFTVKNKLAQSYDPDFDFGTGSFSISLWYKAKLAGQTQNNTLLSRYDNDQGYKIWLNYAGEPCFGIDDDATWNPDDRACPTFPNYVANVDNGNASSTQQNSMFLDSNGYPVIAYLDGGTLDLELIHCTDANCSGTKNFASIDTTGDVGRYLSMVPDSNGYPVISYYDNTNGDLKIVHCGNADCSSGNTISTLDSTGNVGWMTSLKLDSNGYPVVAYYDITNADLKLVRCNDANCTGSDESVVTVESTNSVGQYPSLQLDSNDYPMISHYDTSNVDLRFVHCTDVSCSGAKNAVAVDSTGSVGAYSAMTLDASGNPVIAYADLSYGSTLKVAHCGDSNCSSGNTISAVHNSHDSGYPYINIILNASGFPVITHTTLSHFSTILTTCNDVNCAGGDETHDLLRMGNILAYSIYVGSHQYTSLALDSNGYPVLAIRDTNSGDLGLMHLTSATYSNPNSKDDDAWHHLVAVKNGTSSITTYLDGVAVATDSAISATGTLTSNSAALHLAEDISNGNSLNGWEGYMDEVQIDNTARSSAWISAQFLSESDQFITYSQTEVPTSTQGLIANWKLDEGQGQLAQDATPGKRHATLGADNSASSDDPTWQPNSRCISGPCLSFDGTNDYLNVGQAVQQVKTISLWVRPTTTTTNILALSGSVNITVSSGTISATGFSSPAIYVNGSQSTTLTDNRWQHVIITTSTPISASAITLGKVSSNYYFGALDDIRLYNSTFTPGQAQTSFNQDAGTQLGIKNETFLSDGLVGYWKMDGTSGDASDNSGNSNTAIVVGSNNYASGKFGNALRIGPATTNIMDNPSYEAVTGSYTPGWDTSLNGTEYPTYVFSGYNSGVASPTVGYHGHITPSGGGYRGNRGYTMIDLNTAYGQPHRWQASQDILDTYINLGGLGAKVSVSFMMKTDNAAGKPIQFGLYAGTTYGWVGTQVVKYVSTDNTWQRVTQTFTLGGTDVPDATNIYLYMYGHTGSEATVWIDDVQVELSDTAHPYADGDMGTGYAWVGTAYNGSATRDQSYAATSSIINDTTGTISFWVNPDAIDDTNQCILGPSNGDSSGGTSFTIKRTGIYVDHTYATGKTVTASYTTPPTNGTWYQVTYGWDNTSKSGILFIDGSQASTVTYAQDITIGEYLERLGTCTGTGYTDFSGKIDEVRVYNRALTPKEAFDLYRWSPGPVAYYPLDEGSGSVANDISGNGNISNTFVNSPSWTKGQYGGGINFTKESSQYFTATNESNFDFATALTVETWINVTSNDSYGGVISKTSGNTNGWELRFNSTQGGIGCRVLNGADWGAYSAVSLNAWHHIACTYNTSDNLIRLYVDGVQVSTQTASNGIATNDNPVTFGALAYSTGLGFTGKLDDVRIYNYARTPQQIVEDMNAGHPAGGSPISSQIGYWKFDEGQGTTANNSGSGGSALDLTLSGSVIPTWNSSGKLNKALTFDGNSSYTTKSDNDSLDLRTGGFTGSAWVNSASGTPQHDFIFFKGAGTAVNAGYFFALENSGVLRLQISDGSSYIVDATCTGSKVINDSAWHHAAFTWDPSSGAKIYVDGALDKSCSATSAVDINSSAALIIGGYTSATYSINGSLDEVKIYNSALTADQILTDYNAGSSIKYSVGNDEAADLTDGAGTSPLAEWMLDENAGSSAKDTSGHGYTGTWIGTPKWVPGHSGSAASIDGSTQAIDVYSAALASAFNGAEGTITAWAKVSSASNWTDGTTRRVLTIGADGNNRILIGRTSTNNTIQVVYTANGTSQSINVTTNTTSWFQITITWSKSADQVKVYLNGVQNGTTQTGLQTYTGTLGSTLTVLGAASNTPTAPWSGAIDQIKIYNYARTAAQVAYDYNRGAPVGWWKFDDCTGGTAYDASGNGNNGTISLSTTGTQTTAIGNGDCNTSASTPWYNGRTGKFGSSLNFDGTDDYVNVPNPSNSILDPGTGNFTLATWIKPSDPTRSNRIIRKGNPYNNSGVGYSFLYNGNNSPKFMNLQFNDGQLASTCATNSSVGAGDLSTAWHHVAVVVDRTNFLVYYYLDGIQLGIPRTLNALCTGSVVSSSAFTIGGDVTPTAGLIDDVRYYNYALSATQVKKVMNEGSAVRYGP